MSSSYNPDPPADEHAVLGPQDQTHASGERRAYLSPVPPPATAASQTHPAQGPQRPSAPNGGGLAPEQPAPPPEPGTRYSGPAQQPPAALRPPAQPWPSQQPPAQQPPAQQRPAQQPLLPAVDTSAEYQYATGSPYGAGSPDHAVSPYQAEAPVPLLASSQVPVAAAAPAPVGEDQSYRYTPGPHAVPLPAPATWGKRGVLNRFGFKLQPSADEMIHRAAVQMIRSSFPAPRTIMIGNVKGGAGKTPAALILAHALATYRRESIVAGDFNELRGTLGIRAGVKEPDRTMVDLLGNAEHLRRPESAVGELAGFLRRQESGALVLASSEDAGQMRTLTEDQCETVRRLLMSRYSTLICDTGNNEAAAPWQFVSRVADVLVVPMGSPEDHLHVAAKMLDGLRQRTDTSWLPRRAIVVISDRDGQRIPPQAEQWLSERVGSVHYVPADPEIAAGPISLDRLSEQSLRAWTRVAAAVAEECALPSPHDPAAGYRSAGPGMWSGVPTASAPSPVTNPNGAL